MLRRCGRALPAPAVNASTAPLVAALDAVLAHASAAPAVAVLHLRSDQRAFSAGADLALIESCFATPQGPDVMTEVVRNMQRLYRRPATAPLAPPSRSGAAPLRKRRRAGLSLRRVVPEDTRACRRGAQEDRRRRQ